MCRDTAPTGNGSPTLPLQPRSCQGSGLTGLQHQPGGDPGDPWSTLLAAPAALLVAHLGDERGSSVTCAVTI